jgi:phosphatidylserine/phosphatidylglycerophosphate/cardiolipin synthase-like enzyme
MILRQPLRRPKSHIWYGANPPWHDVQLELRGPVVGALDTTFRERWDDPTSLTVNRPFAWLRDTARGANLDPDPLPPQPPESPGCGAHAVQVLGTYPRVRPRYPFAPQGQRSIARGYSKAIKRARRLIYLEDRYMWSTDVASLFARALRRNPDLHLVVVVPRHPDIDGAWALPPNIVGRQQAIALCKRAGGERVHVLDVENPEGVPVYVHAKVCVVDDVWASVGSDNLNRRSWTHDSELSCAVLDPTRDERAPTDPAGTGDGARVYSRDLRLRVVARAPGPARRRQRGREPDRARAGPRRDHGGRRRAGGVARGRLPGPTPAGTAALASAGAARQAVPAVGGAGVPGGLRPGRSPAAQAPAPGVVTAPGWRPSAGRERIVVGSWTVMSPEGPTRADRGLVPIGAGAR